MRELRVEDALLYLDQVKVEFGDRPHIYNEFLDIMKTFKTQQIDTPGVIRRVSTLFQGNRRLVLGFNTFLPEGYKIELPLDGDGPPVAVFRAPGSNVAHILHSTGPLVGPPTGGGVPSGVVGVPHGQMMPSGQQQQQHQRGGMLAHGPGQAPPGHAIGGAQSPMRQLGGPQQLQQQHVMGQRGSGGIGPKSRMEPPAQFAQKSRAMSQQHHQQQQQALQQGIMAGGGRAVGQPSAEALGQAPQMQDGKIPAQQQPGSRAGGMQPLQQAPASRFENQQQQAEQQGHSPTAPPEAAAAGQQQQQQAGAPLEFDHAINYVTTIKKRFASEPETYKKFLEILHTYQKEQRGIKEVLDEVSVLFADHPDLLKEFTYFLPDAVQAQAKAQLDAVAKESEARKRAQARQAIMSQAQGMQRQAQRMTGPRGDYDRGAIQIPFGATQGRSLEQEQQLIESAEYGEVSFAPVRPPRSKELTPAQAAAKEGRPLVIPEPYVTPNTVETIFFQRAKAHLSRKELSSDKTPNQRRHTPYVEFLKCLHLFGAGILNKEELILLLRGLFTQGHAPKGVMGHNPNVSSDAAELLRDFEEILVGRGPYAEQENALKDKSKYGSLRICDIDFTGCSGPTPSYRVYPTDYPKSLFLSFPDQTDEENAILNKKFVCVGSAENRSKMADSLEAYDGVRLRHNVYEETMARIEDERYDFDMAIERNAQAMRQIEPLAEEAQNLRQREEKDGQPIGRLQYRLKQNTMNSILINAVGRIYGDRGDEVLQHLLRNPLIVLPIVYQRLKQKDAEWRKAKADNMDRWNAATEASYEGSLDVLCYFQRRDIEKTFASSHLLEQCKKAKTYIRHPEMLRDRPAARDFSPTFSTGCSDATAVCFEPRLAVPCKVDAAHKDAFQLVAHRLQEKSNVAAIDRERIGRIWAEFVVPWFKYPTHWVMDEVRNSFAGRLTPAVVRFAPGQRVRTIYGDGVITSFTEAKHEYRVKLSFGIGHLRPSALLHPLAVKETPYVRRDGTMVREYDVPVVGGGGAKLGAKYQLLYGTERIYIFMRLYTLLTNLLANVREHCETFASGADPADHYHNPAHKEGGKRRRRKSERLDYSGMLSMLKKLLADECDTKEFESLGLKVSKEKVHVMAALPKLADRCVESLVSVAKEDVLLHLYDYCQYREVDPSLVRKQCFAMAPDADFRIQYDGSESLSFSYLPKSMEFPTAPTETDEVMEDNNNNNDEPPTNGQRSREQTEEEAVAAAPAPAPGGAATAEDEDPIEEFTDGEPPNKKPRVNK